MNNKPKKLINIYVLFLFDGYCLQLGDDGFEGGRGGLEGDRRGVASGTEDNQRRAVVETAVVRDVEFVGVVVTTADSCDTGIALDGKLQFILRHRHPTALAVDGLDAEVHQVGAVSSPCGVLRGDSQAHSLPCGLDPVAGDWLSSSIGNRFEMTVGIGDVIPADLIALLGVALGVVLASQTLAVEQ